MSAIFRDNGTSGNWTTTGSNTTFGGNNGMFGSLGASTSLHINYSGSAYVFEGTEKNLGATATYFQFYLRPDSAATIGNGNTIFSVWDSAYSVSPIRIDFTHISGSNYSFSLTDPSNSYAGVTGSTVIALGTAVCLKLYQTSAGWYLYLNNGTTPEITYTHTQTTVGWQYISVGTHYQNAVGSYTGVMDFGEFWIGNMNSAPSGASATAYEMYQGYLQNHLAVSGQPYRGPADGANGSYTPGYIDTVSEGAAYLLMLEVQNNDQASFILTDNWILKNLLRSNSTTGNTSSNAAPTNALNLMAFKYNSANTDGKGIGTIYDANWAGDADPERAQALLWAHNRFGSSALTVGITGELVTPNYLQRAINVINDLRTYALRSSSATGYYYLVNDSYQTSDPVQIGPDYNSPGAFKLFAQYDSSNAAIWNGTVSGAYDILTKSANQIMTGATPAQSTTSKLTPDWIAFTLSTGLTSGTPSTYGDSDYSFNSFRTYSRLYETYLWYGDAGALAALQLPKSFFTSEWAANTAIRSTFKHDGTNTGSYESNLFIFAAYWTLYANDPSNSVANSIATTKLNGRFSQQPYGSVFNETPATGTGVNYDYFGQSWMLRNYMQQNGLWKNYGQASAIVTPTISVAPNTGAFFGF